MLENARSKEEELKFKRAQEEIHRKALYKQELQDQMILKEKLKRCDYESFLQEKKMQDEIVQRIQDEDERERQEKECRRRKTQEEMMAFKAAQEVWKRKERDVLEEEHKNIQMYLQSRQSDIDSRYLHFAYLFRKVMLSNHLVLSISTPNWVQKWLQNRKKLQF